jgi:hypothetical protein
VNQTLALQRLAAGDATWKLLRADNSPVIVALLSDHLGGDDRRLSAADLYERIDHDLDALRAHGIAMPQTAQSYCAEWRKAGFLIRRPDEVTRDETFELASGALGAIRIIEQLVAPRQTATESRLASIGAQLGQLALDTDPDATRRLEQLHAQRDRIDAQIGAINAGELDTLDPAKSLERVRDILDQAREIPSDFARVRAEFETLNQDLRARIVESDETQSAVLDEVFRGVDMIAESDEGRSFAGFSALVLDPVVGGEFDDSIARVLSREFTAQLPVADRRTLRRFIGTLKEHSGEIHDVITTFARGLRRYVQSQDYQRDRVLRGLLRDSLAAGVDASAHIKPYQATGLSLELSAVSLGSAGAVRLHDPGELDATSPITVHESGFADLAALRALARETEIDFTELTRNVNELLGEVEQCTVAEVLERYPASQGAASVVGLLALAANQGVVSLATPGADQAATETVRWIGIDQTPRAATVPIHRFVGRLQ